MLHMLDTDTTSYLIKGRSPAIEAKLAGLPPAMVCISVMTRARVAIWIETPASRTQVAPGGASVSQDRADLALG